MVPPTTDIKPATSGCASHRCRGIHANRLEPLADWSPEGGYCHSQGAIARSFVMKDNGHDGLEMPSVCLIEYERFPGDA
jgi:hypothetical protein